MAAYAGWMTYGRLRADCLYTGISSGPNARYRVWEAFTFLLLSVGYKLTYVYAIKMQLLQSVA